MKSLTNRLFQRNRLGHAGTRITLNLKPILATLVTGTGLLATQSWAQTGGTLPVYRVTQTGATSSQATELARQLNLPASLLAPNNGLIAFLDSSNYLSVPTVPVTDPTVINELMGTTSNRYPAIPISFQRIDLQALNNQPVLGSNTAVAVFSNALASANLVPQSLYNGFIYGIPVPSSVMFNGSYADSAGLISANHPLDTEVNYVMYDRNGYPFIGPGMQVQAAFDGYGNVTRLLYSARQLTSTGSVSVISSALANSRAASLFPAGAQVSLELAYWCPPLPPWPNPPSRWNPANIIPWYVCRGAITVTNPATGRVTPIHLKPRMIPATDDPTYVPSVSLQAYTPGGTSVVANVSVGGGMPPYTYVWEGSNTTGSNTDSSVSYTPIARFSPPPLQIAPAGASALELRWMFHPTGPGPDPAPDGWVLETTGSLGLASNLWTQVTSQVQSNNNIYSVQVAPTAAAAYFRLRLTTPTLSRMENIGVTVVDANGVSVHASQVLAVQATLVQALKGGVGISYGTESPREPDFAIDRIGWQTGMASPGGGSQSFCWMSDLVWPGDFIEPTPPGTLVGTPWVYGDADYGNWGVNSASIVLNNTDGWADGFAASQPGATLAQYATAELRRPGYPGGTVVIGLNNYADTASTHYYNINYNGSWTPIGPHDGLFWLCMDCCDLLDEYNGDGLYATDRWKDAFGGLHLLTGWNSEEQVGDGSFEKDFALNFLGVGKPAQTISQAWFNSAKTAGAGHGAPAIMGAFGPAGISDYTDYYWGKGPVNATFTGGAITGWWYVH